MKNELFVLYERVIRTRLFDPIITKARMCMAPALFSGCEDCLEKEEAHDLRHTTKTSSLLIHSSNFLFSSNPPLSSPPLLQAMAFHSLTRPASGDMMMVIHIKNQPVVAFQWNTLDVVYLSTLRAGITAMNSVIPKQFQFSIHRAPILREQESLIRVESVLDFTNKLQPILHLMIPDVIPEEEEENKKKKKKKPKRKIESPEKPKKKVVAKKKQKVQPPSDSDDSSSASSSVVVEEEDEGEEEEEEEEETKERRYRPKKADALRDFESGVGTVVCCWDCGSHVSINTVTMGSGHHCRQVSTEAQTKQRQQWVDTREEYRKRISQVKGSDSDAHRFFQYKSSSDGQKLVVTYLPSFSPSPSHSGEEKKREKKEILPITRDISLSQSREELLATLAAGAPEREAFLASLSASMSTSNADECPKTPVITGYGDDEKEEEQEEREDEEEEEEEEEKTTIRALASSPTPMWPYQKALEEIKKKRKNIHDKQ